MRLKLAAMRESSPYSQAEVAKAVGVSPKTEWNWENNKSFPNAEQLFALCDLFHTDPNTMVGWYDDHPEDMPAEAPPGLTPGESRVLSDYRDSTPQGRRDIEKYAGERRELAGLSRQDGESYEEGAA